MELKDINKSFGPVRANVDVCLKVAAGAVHGIVGENGAGKSTLMSILYGFYEADRGDVFIDGKKVVIDSSEAAIAAGIGMVHQHFMLVDTFTVLENVMLGAEAGPLLAESAAQASIKLKHLADTYGLIVDMNAITGELPVGEQQRAEILKALYRGARILILDEPTGVLTPQEADQLFDILRALKAEGVTILLITHKLREIMDITDTVSVMRHGEMVAHRVTVETSKEELAELMVGRKVIDTTSRVAEHTGQPSLIVENLTVYSDLGVPLVNDVSFRVRAGEIVGIAGVSGNGQSELLETLSGIRPIDRGRIVLNGREITPETPCDPAEVRQLKVAHVPEDRHRMGLLTAFQARESIILGYHRSPRYNASVLLDQQAIGSDCEHLMEDFDVRPRQPDIKSANMSGGNQQKLILAREIDKAPEVLFVGQPTRGVDIGAIEFIHEQLLDMRDGGCAILMVSVEIEEIMKLSDRILVMFDGRVVGDVERAQADVKTLGLMMANAHDGATVAQGASA
ncbi:MAG TPA: ABC transporter ATP-binding protein [Rhodospirillales bacterium]|nr:ABC transporter ATP-binding protein [Rhodospirillales bacterium]